MSGGVTEAFPGPGRRTASLDALNKPLVEGLAHTNTPSAMASMRAKTR
jgi:hypothetical protein